MTIWRRPGGRLEIAGYLTALVGPMVLTAIVARLDKARGQPRP